MEIWILAALANPLIFSVVALIDKRVLSGFGMPLPAFNVFVGGSQGVFGAVVLLSSTPSGVEFDVIVRAWSIGMLQGVSLILLFWMLKREDPSRVIPAMQTTPIYVALLALVIPVVGTQTVNLVGDYQEGRFREAVVELSSNLPETWHEHADRLIRYLPVGGEPSEPDHSRGAAGEQGDASAAAGRDDETARIRAIVRQEMERAAGVAGSAEPPTSDSQRFLGLARGSARAVGSLLGGILQLGFVAFLVPFYFFFFSVSYPAVVNFARGLVPEANRPRTFELLSKMDRVVAGFVRGRIVISLIMGVMLAVGWWICQVPYAITLGLVVGIFCAVPYLGVVGVPLAVGLLFFGQLGAGGEPTVWLGWWGVVLWPTAVFVVVQVIESYGLTPTIAGKATNLDPVTIVVAVLAGGSIMGVYGMLLAIPAAACIKIVCTDVLLPRIRAWTKGESADPLPIDRDD